MIRESSSYTSSKSLANTKLFMSRDIYKSLHEMDSFDATTMGIVCYTQKNKNVSKNIYWFFIDVTKVCIICTLSEHGIRCQVHMIQAQVSTSFPQVFPQSFPQDTKIQYLVSKGTRTDATICCNIWYRHYCNILYITRYHGFQIISSTYDTFWRIKCYMVSNYTLYKMYISFSWILC